MFARFKYEPEEEFFDQKLKAYLPRGNEIYKEYKNDSQKCLSEFIKQNGVIDGTALQNHWFNIKKADVFISHSHKDIELVKGFTGWLYEVFGLTAFIDSCAWGYCDDLLKMIDDQYCKNEKSNTYNYNLRNYSTLNCQSEVWIFGAKNRKYPRFTLTKRGGIYTDISRFSEPEAAVTAEGGMTLTGY